MREFITLKYKFMIVKKLLAKDSIKTKRIEYYMMSYDELHHHIGHKLELNDIWDWHTNREVGIEIRCADCEGCEPLLDYDLPDECQSNNHTEHKGELWTCEKCKKVICEEEGADDECSEICDECAMKKLKNT